MATGSLRATGANMDLIMANKRREEIKLKAENVLPLTRPVQVSAEDDDEYDEYDDDMDDEYDDEYDDDDDDDDDEGF